MLFFDRRVCDYEVVGMFVKVGGEKVVTKRVCHNVSRKEAACKMKRWVQSEYAETLDVHRPIKVDVKLVQ